MNNLLRLALFINLVVAAMLYICSRRKSASSPARRLPPDWIGAEVDGDIYYADICDPDATKISRAQRRQEDRAA